MQKTFYKVADFIAWQKSGGLRLAPEFQRRSVWRPGAKSFLMDSVVRDLPIPIIFLRDRRTDPKTFSTVREVIDGQQRLRTVISFIAPELLKDFDSTRDAFTVKKTHNKEIAGKKFDELEESIKQAILDYEFDVHVLPAAVDDREVIQIFRRMNSTNYTLTKQELRNAKFFGEFKTSSYLLAAEQLHRWRQWKTFSEDDIARMTEVEFTAECLVSFMDAKVGGRLAKRIDRAYEAFDEEFHDRDEIESRYRFVLDQIDSHFSSTTSNFVFFRRRLIYPLILAVYDLCFGLTTSTVKKARKSALTTEHQAGIKKASDRLVAKSAPEDVIKAAERRTNDPKERLAIFNYLLKHALNA